MEQKIFYSHIPYSHNVPYRFFGRISVHFGLPQLLPPTTAGNTEGGSITVPLASCLTGLD